MLLLMLAAALDTLAAIIIAMLFQRQHMLSFATPRCCYAKICVFSIAIVVTARALPLILLQAHAMPPLFRCCATLAAADVTTPRRITCRTTYPCHVSCLWLITLRVTNGYHHVFALWRRGYAAAPRIKIAPRGDARL